MWPAVSGAHARPHPASEGVRSREPGPRSSGSAMDSWPEVDGPFPPRVPQAPRSLWLLSTELSPAPCCTGPMHTSPGAFRSLGALRWPFRFFPNKPHSALGAAVTLPLSGPFPACHPTRCGAGCPLPHFALLLNPTSTLKIIPASPTPVLGWLVPCFWFHSLCKSLSLIYMSSSPLYCSFLENKSCVLLISVSPVPSTKTSTTTIGRF